MTTTFIGVKEFRQNLASLSKRSREKQERFIVLRRNQPIFEVRPLSKKDATLERFHQDIEEALDDVKHGRVHTQAEIEEYFGLK